MNTEKYATEGLVLSSWLVSQDVPATRANTMAAAARLRASGWVKVRVQAGHRRHQRWFPPGSQILTTHESLNAALKKIGV